MNHLSSICSGTSAMRILRILIDEKRRLGAIVVRFYGNASVFQSVCFAVFISSHRTIKHNIKKHNASHGRLQFYNFVKKRNGAFFDDTARLGLYSGLGTLYMANGASTVPAGRRRTRTPLAPTEFRGEDQPAIQGQGQDPQI
jgi:hypothetical protein